MSLLIIGPTETAAIDAAVSKAREHPTPWSVLREVAVNPERTTLELKDRKNPERLKAIQRAWPTQMVMLGTYRCEISFEEQPSGIVRHLSVSSRDKTKVPGIAVMALVSKAFGFDGEIPPRRGTMWVEEWKPGVHAVNIVQVEVQ